MKLSLLPLQNDDVVRIRCEGPISLRGLAASDDPLAALVGPHFNTLKVLMNLERAQGIDTSGVSWLMRELKAFGEGGGRLVLYSVPPVVTHVLDFLHVTASIPIAASDVAAREMALSDVKGPAIPSYHRPDGAGHSVPGRLPG